MQKVGMLGAGFILSSHARSVGHLPGCALAVIGDLSVSRTAAAMRDYGFAERVRSLEEMAASDCDSVHVLLPPTLHERAVRTLIDAGKAVFVEKPFVLGSVQANDLADAAERTGVRLGVNHNFLFGRNYQPLRDMVRNGELGKVDSLSVEWNYQLPFIKHGPYDNWIVSAPANPLFEVAPHPLGFVLDLIGVFDVASVEESNPVTLPSGVVVPQRWRILGSRGDTAVTVQIGFTPGYESRTLSLRAAGGSIHYDYGRDIGRVDRAHSDNPMLDAYWTARSSARQVARQASQDIRRRVMSALRQQPGNNPFEESIFHSVAAFYADLEQPVDGRHSARFAAQTIALVEQIVGAAGHAGSSHPQPAIGLPPPLRPSTVLIVGGTGFIGRALVRRLLADGHGVRVVTRTASSAALALAGLPVDLVEGHHGDEAFMSRALTGIETVYHLAKCEGRNWQDYLEGDVEPTRVLGLVAAKAGVKRLIYTGTIDSYDSGSPRRTIDNATPVDPRIAGRNLYARSKAACEAVLTELTRSHGLNLVIIRPGIVVGAGSPPAHPGVGKFISDTEVTYWGHGENKLPLVHVDDVAEALAKAVGTPGIDGATFLVSGPPLLSARDYVAELEIAAQCRIAARAKSPMMFWLADAAKEAAKNLIRHRNRRSSTLHDWQCRSHLSHYDARETEAVLDWHPIDDAVILRQRGIHEAVAAG